MPSAFVMDPLAVWIAAALLSALFAHAALAKLADRALLEQHLAAYGLPWSALPVATWALPGVELTAAVLVLTPLRALGAGLCAALLLGYAGVMAWHRAHGHRLDCGCGGEPLPVSWALVTRNLVLAVVAAVAALPVTGRAMPLPEFALVAGAVLLGTVLYAAFHQVLRHLDATQSRPSLRSL